MTTFAHSEHVPSNTGLSSRCAEVLPPKATVAAKHPQKCTSCAIMQECNPGNVTRFSRRVRCSAHVRGCKRWLTLCTICEACHRNACPIHPPTEAQDRPGRARPHRTHAPHRSLVRAGAYAGLAAIIGGVLARCASLLASGNKQAAEAHSMLSYSELHFSLC